MASRPVLILQQVSCEGPGALLDILKARGVPYDVLDMERERSVPQLEGYRALIAMGGPMGAYDEGDYPFLGAEDAAIKRALRSRLPFLGVCLGGQLLAKALGARVKRNRVKEIGFSEVELTPWGRRDPLFEGFGAAIPVFQWHGDTFSIPRGAARLATAPACRNQAFRYGPNAYALQFHLETTPEMLRSWVDAYRGELEASLVKPSAVLPPEIDARCAELRRSAERLFGNFLRIR